MQRVHGIAQVPLFGRYGTFYFNNFCVHSLKRRGSYNNQQLNYDLKLKKSLQYITYNRIVQTIY